MRRENFMNVLILGVSGFVGSNLADFLVKKEVRCYGLSRTTGLLSDYILNSSNFKFIQFDLNKLKEYIPDQLKQKFDVVYYCASLQPGKPMDWNDYYKINVELLLDAYRFVETELFVFVSTASVYGDSGKIINESTPLNPIDYYGLSKCLAEKLIEIEFYKNPTKPKTVVIRFNSMVGKNLGEGLVKTIYDHLSKNKDLELYSYGKPLRNIIHIEDAAEILYRVALNKDKFSKFDYLVAGGSSSASVLEIANLIREKIGSKSKIILSEKTGKYNNDVVMDIGKLISKLEFSPRTTLQAVEKFIDDIRGEDEN